jgi:hypothetical protein
VSGEEFLTIFTEKGVISATAIAVTRKKSIKGDAIAVVQVVD